MKTDPVQNKSDEVWSITGWELIGKIETGSSSSNMNLNFPLQEIITKRMDELSGEGAPKSETDLEHKTRLCGFVGIVLVDLLGQNPCWLSLVFIKKLIVVSWMISAPTFFLPTLCMGLNGPLECVDSIVLGAVFLLFYGSANKWCAMVHIHFNSILFSTNIIL